MEHIAKLTASLRPLINTMREAGFSEITLQVPDFKLRIVLDSDSNRKIDADALQEAQTNTNTAVVQTDIPTTAQAQPVYIKAGQVGVFSFGRNKIEPNTDVLADQPLGVIKGMSIQDRVTAPVAGKITKIMVEEGQIIDFGFSMFELVPQNRS